MNVNTALGTRKPLWLSIVGWLSLVGFLTPCALAAVESVSHYRIPRTVWPGYALFAAFLLMPVWLIGTVIYRVQRGQARMTAAELMAAARARQIQEGKTKEGG